MDDLTDEVEAAIERQRSETPQETVDRLQAKIDDITVNRAAFRRADAWARRAGVTPYGS